MSKRLKNEDLINHKFGRLLILDTYMKNGVRYCKCKCDCGAIKIITYSHIYTGDTKSCGCYNIYKAKRDFTKHSKSKHPLFGVWNSMKQRCNNKNNNRYKDYGGRGIKVCDEWLNNFMNFYNWAIDNGYEEGLTIDRIDVNGNYEPTNCRIVNMIVQQNNRRDNIVINFKGVSKTLSEWSRELNIKMPTLYKRIFILKWSIERAFSTKVRKRNS